jgi:hypothetical protein
MTKWILVLAMCACHSTPRSATTVTQPQVAELTARRAQMIDWLREYYERGVYPTDDAGKPISVFKDARGVRCPMAELIYRSGHGDLVDAVAAGNNKLRLADVKAGPVHDWMAQSGLTIEEIAMVQGAMELDYSWMPVQEHQQTILAQGQVRGRLETAVTALTNNTNQSVDAAAKRLGKRAMTVAFAPQPPQPVAASAAVSAAGFVTTRRLQPRAIRTLAGSAKASILQP